MRFEASREFAKSLDQQDELHSLRSLFHIPMSEGQEWVYLTGNSLGLQPKSTRSYLEEECKAWQDRAVEAHTQGRYPWLSYHEFLTEGLARLCGASVSEVVVMNSLTVNLHLMLTSFYQPTPNRYEIWMENDPFPSDTYAATSQAKLHGFPEAIRVFTPKSGTVCLSMENIKAQIEEHSERIALVLLGQPNYKSGQVFDIAEISQLCRSKGIILGLDIAHGIGNLELKLHEWGVDFAVWCSYKYLNAGPGGIGGAFAHERHHRKDLPRLCGWWGHDKQSRFEMPAKFIPIPTVEAWQVSNPPIFQAAALRASLEIFDAIGMKKLLKKGQLMGEYLEFLCASSGMQSVTSKCRGCQLSFETPQAESIVNFLRKALIIADYRHPNIVRVAPVPLYNTFEDVWRFVEGLCQRI